MKIAFVDNLPEGGAKRVLFEQMKWFSQKHELSWFTNTQESSFPFNKIVRQVSRYSFESGGGTGIKRLVADSEQIWGLFQGYAKMRQDIDAFKPEVIIVHPDMVTQSPLVLSFLSCPTVYYMEEWLRIAYEPETHNIQHLPFFKRVYESSKRRLLARIDYWNTRSASVLVTNSNYTASNVQKAYGRKAKVIHPGVDLMRFKPKPNASRDYFLFVGSPNKNNGYRLLKKALEIAPMKLSLKFIPFKDGFSVSEAELVKLYQNAVATLCLGVNEPFGLASIESMACKTPVIAVAQGGYLETVEDQETGVLVEPEPEQLLKAMVRLAKDEELRKKLAENGRRRVNEYFSWKLHGEKMEELIEGLVK